MAVLMIEGFDAYNGGGTSVGIGSKWVGGGGDVWAPTTGRFSGQCFAMQGGNFSGTATARRWWGSDQTSISIGCAVKFGAGFSIAVAGSPIMAFEDAGSTQHCYWYASTLGQIVVQRAGVTLGTSPINTLLSGVWHYVECEVTISDTVGVFKVYVDGAQVLNLTSLDTRNGTSSVINSLLLQVQGFGHACAFDDMYIVSGATRLGERKIELLIPNADTAQKDWTPNSGSTNYTQVDDGSSVDSNTTYVGSVTVGHRDLYTITSLSSSPTTIDAVNVICFAEKLDAATRALNLSIDSSGTGADGSLCYLPFTYTRLESLYSVDPNGSGAWTTARVNGLKIGPTVGV